MSKHYKGLVPTADGGEWHSHVQAETQAEAFALIVRQCHEEPQMAATRPMLDQFRLADVVEVPSDGASSDAAWCGAIEACKAAIARHIPSGPLSGNGCDKQAERNGMVLAYNLLCEMLEHQRSQGR